MSGGRPPVQRSVMRLTGAMRAVLVLVMSSALLSACSLFGRGDDQSVPEGDAWRTEVITAIEQTPGVVSADLTVNDVDSGTGSRLPLLQGAFTVDGDTQTVTDEALRRAADVMGEESSGVRVKLSVRDASGTATRISELGYPGVSNGRALWEATR